MKLVGLTGGIATGKSTVARILRERSVPVIDADQVAREVVAKGTPGLAAIVQAFGSEVLDEDGTLDRRAMRRRILQDAEARKTLESITHPAILESIARQIAALAMEGHAAAVVEAALLVETGSYKMYPYLVVVSCKPETQVARVIARDDTTEEQARKVLDAQLPMADKEAVATHVIRNDGSLDALSARVDEVWSSILEG